MRIKIQFQFPEIVFGIMLAVALFALGAVFSSNYSPNNQPHESAQTQANAPTKNMSADKRLADYTFALDILTAFLVAATFGLGLVTWKGIRNQSKETRILQRAYISAQPGGIKPFISDPYFGAGDRIVAHVDFVNVGRLPARNVTVDRAYIAWNPSYRVRRFHLKKVEPLTIVLGPGNKMRVGTADRSPKRLGRYGYLYVWGRVEYTDGFGEPRFTEFCHRYPCGAAEGPRIRAKHARYHQHGNDAD